MKKVTLLLTSFAFLLGTAAFTGCTAHTHSQTAVASRANTRVVVVKKRPVRHCHARRGVVVVRR